MKNALKRSLSILLAITIIFSSAYVGLNELDYSGLFAFNPFKDLIVKSEAASESDLTFELNEDGQSYSVINCNQNASGELIIPDTYNDLPVTAISDYAFDQCRNITLVTIPDSVTTIGRGAFEYCTSLTTVIIPDTVTNIDNCAFQCCSALTSISLPKDIEVISLGLFNVCTSLTSIIIPEGVTTIGDSAFSSCESLEAITIPESVTNIGDNSFSTCKSLTSVTISDSVTIIGEGAFALCTSLTEINIDEGNLNYASVEGVFFNKDKTTLIQYPAGKKNSDYIIPDEVTSISDKAFYSCQYLTSIIIPESLTDIGDNAFKNCENLISLDIPSCVTSLGYHSFEKCKNLESVTIGEGLSYIGSESFYDCDSLSGFYVNENNTYFSSYDGVLFNKNKSVLIQYPAGKESSAYVIPEEVVRIGTSAFRNSGNLNSITISKNVTKIDRDAFYNCKNLNKLHISDIASWCSINFETDGFYPSNPLSYAHNLYLNNELVTELVIPEGVTSISSRAFYRCTSITSVSFPESLTEIGHWAFDGCTNLTAVYITNIANWCNFGFYTSGDEEYSGCFDNPLYYAKKLYLNGELVTDLVIPDGITNIAYGTFHNCDSLNSITLPISVTDIGYEAFAECSNLDYVFYGGSKSDWTNIAIGSDNTPLTNAAIHYNSTDHTYEVTVESVGSCTQNGVTHKECTVCGYTETLETSATGHDFVNGICTVCGAENTFVYTIENDSVTITGYTGTDANIIIPSTIEGFPVISIGDSAFSGCSSLTSIIIPDSVTTIVEYAFYECNNLGSITIGSGLTNIGYRAFYGCNLVSISVVEANTVYSSVDGILFNKDKTTLILYPEQKSDTEYTIPATVTFINDYAFGSCYNLTSITIPDSVTTIGEYAFSECGNLTSVIIPDSVTSLGGGVFYWCDNLTCVTIGKSVANIGNCAFHNCTSLTSITIPDSVASIGWEAFYGCNSLTSVTISDSVTSVDFSAFDGCDSLGYVFYSGSESEWANITIGSNNTSLTNAPIHYDSTDHTYGDWVIDTEANCAEEGSKHRVCSVCEHTETLAITALGHNYSNEWIIDKAATCTEDGSKSRHCLTCGEKIDVTVITATGHIYGDWTVTLEPTCTEEGFAERVCSTCGNRLVSTEFTTEQILDSSTYPESQHNYGNSISETYEFSFEGAKGLVLTFSSSTYTESGYDYIYIYDETGTLYGKYSGSSLSGTVISLEGSSFSIELTSDGSVTKYGFSFDSIVAVVEGLDITNPLGHNYSTEWTIDKEATCTEDGSKSHHCSNCDDKSDVTVITATGHNYVDGYCTYCDSCIAFEYTVENNTITITGYTGNRADVVIPSEIDGLPVVAIGDSAFYECSIIKTITLSDNISSIGNAVFFGCYKLSSFYVDKNSPYYSTIDGVLFNKDKTELVAYPAGKTNVVYTVPETVTQIGNFAFASCYYLSEVTLTANVEAIGLGAFAAMELLATINLNEGLKTIGEYAFNDSRALAGIEIPDSVTSIGEGAFSYCESLRKISLPESITTIAGETFNGCYDLREVAFTDKLVSIEDRAFYGCDNLHSVFYSGSEDDWSTTVIGNYNDDLLNATVHFNSTGHTMVDCMCQVCGFSIWSYMTYEDHIEITGYNGIDSDAVIPDTIDGLPVVAIGDYAFSDCDCLTTITIPDSVTNIGDYAFNNCDSLTAINVDENNPEYSSVDGVLYNKDITVLYLLPLGKTGTYIMPDTVISFNDEEVFYGSRITSLHIGSSFVALSDFDPYEFAETEESNDIFFGVLFYSCTMLSEITVSQNNPYYSAEDGVLYNKEKTELVFAPLGKKGIVTVPQGVTAIHPYAFIYSNASIVVLPKTIDLICSVAFVSACPITIIIPSNVDCIMEEAFLGNDIPPIIYFGGTDVSSFPEEYFEYSQEYEDEYGFTFFNNELPVTVNNCNGFDYIVKSDSTVTLVRYNGTETTVTIPAEIDGYVVSEIYPTIFGLYVDFYSEIKIPTVEKVIIEEGITELPFGAFVYCLNLSEIQIPDSVTTIGKYAFEGCENLTEITIPDSVTSIAEEAFIDCYTLASINVDINNPNYSSVDGVLFNKDKTVLIRYPEGKTDTAYTIPDSVTSIVDYAFFSCNNLTSITIPDNVTSIGDSAFRFCYYLTSVTIGNGVTNIGDSAFRNCGSLTSITIPDSVTSIGDEAFNDCYDLTTVILGNGVTSIGEGAFYSCGSLTSITIPDSVTSIGDGAFSYCTSLTSITISDSVTSIGDNAFYCCENVISVTIPDSVTSIGSDAFYGTSYYNDSSNWEHDVLYIGNHIIDTKTSISGEYVIKSGTKTIAGSAFNDCSNLTSIILPDGVESIGDNAFYSCDNLTSITIPDSVTSIGDYAFYYCNNLADVFYSGTQNEWSDVTIEDGNECLINATIHFVNPHIYSDWVVALEPTCTENGLQSKTCSDCGDVVTEVIDALGHDYSIEWTIDKAATCTTNGSKSHHCSRCDSTTDITVITATGHLYSDWITDREPTCTVAGSKRKTCSVCQNVVTESIDALGHDYSTDWTTDKEATCTEDGSKSHHCSRCSSKSDITAIPAIGHNYSDWVVTLEPTCTKEGSKKQTCSNCGDVVTEAIDALGHDYSSEWTIDVEATCTEDGSKSHHCTRCDSKADITVIPATNHNYSDWVVTLEPTCTKEGSKKQTCSNCGDVITEAIEALGHDYSTEWTIDKAVTCTTDGSKSRHCSRCDGKTDITVITATGHIYGDWVTDREPTCTVAGSKHKTCSVCQNVVTEAIEAIGHDYSNEWIIDKAATCTTDGSKSRHCSRCDSKADVTVITAIGHLYGDWIIDTEATVLSEGAKHRICSVCSNEEAQVIEKIEIDIESNTDYGLAVFTVVHAQTLEPIRDAQIFISTENDGENTFTTDSNGQVSVVLPVGKQVISAYAEGCLTRNLRINVKSGVNEIPQIGLSELSTYDAELTSELMTIEEIEAAGIDTSDPDNQHVYKYELKLEFEAEIDWYSFFYYMNGVGEIIGGGTGDSNGGYWVPNSTLSTNSSGGYFHIPGIKGRESVSVYPVSEYFYLIIRGEVRWLKEMFDVEMLVINNSLTDTLEDLTATLELPEGLSLAKMVGEQQGLVQEIDHVAEGESESVHWYVRGDKEGSYDLQARLQGTIMPFEEEIDDLFIAENQLQVLAGSALKLHFEFPDAAYYGEDYPITITLTNVSDRTLYNISHMIQVEQGMEVYYSDGTSKTKVETSSWISSGIIREFYPGDKIIIETSVNIFFKSEMMERELEKYIGLIDGIEQLINGYKAVTAALDIFKFLDNCVTSCTKAMDDFIASAAESSDKLDLFKELHDKLSSLYTSYSTTGNKTIDAAINLANTGLNGYLNAITEDPDAWFATHSVEDIKALLDGVKAFENSITASKQPSKKFDIFDSLRTAISAIPIRFALKNVIMTEDENNTTSIPWSYSTTKAGPQYFGVSNVSKYMISLVQMIGAEAYEASMPGIFMAIPGVDDPFNKDEAIKYIQATEDEIAQFKAKDATGEVKFKVWVERNEASTYSLRSTSVSGDFLLSCDNETATYEDGVLTFTGDGMISVTPQSQTGGTLYIEDSEGNTYTYVIDVVEQHTCECGEREVVISPTAEFDGFAVKSCTTCSEIMEVEVLAYSDCCEEHTFAEWVEEEREVCTDSTLRSRCCSTCGFTETEFVSGVSHTFVDRVCSVCGIENSDESLFDYEITDDSVTITDSEITDGEVVIPDEINGLPVTEIGSSAFEGSEDITSIVIPGSVTNIGDSAFENCDSLEYIFYTGSESDWENISIGDNNTAITDAIIHYGSTDHSYIEKVDVEATCTEDGSKHQECSVCGYSLESEVIPALGHDYSTEWTIDVEPTCTEEGSKSHHCSRCDSKADVTVITATDHIYGEWVIDTTLTCTQDGKKYRICSVCDKTETIEEAASGHKFVDGVCTVCNVKDVFEYTIKNNCVTITGYRSWSDTEVVIPSEIEGLPVTSIGDSAFYFCYNLTSVVIPDSVISIGYEAFQECTSLISVTIGNGLTSIGEGAFRYTSLNSITIPDSVTYIGSGAFYQTDYYDDINNWENDILYIDNHLIKAKTSLSGAYEIKEGTKSIASGAFWGCDSLTSVVIPDSVAGIGDEAFRDCDGLASVIISDNVKGIGDRAFYDCDNLKEITVDEDNTAYSSVDGVLFNKDKTVLIQYPIGKTKTSYTIPNTVISIGDFAFSYCLNLTSVTISKGVTSIGEYAFDDCDNLTTIRIPNSVTSIGSSAFSNCINLTSITIPDGVTNIEAYAFQYCKSLTSIIIPEGVTTIKYSAFEYCTNLASVTIPDSVTMIDDRAFYACKSLENIAVGEYNSVYSSVDGILFNKDKTTLIQYPAGKKNSDYIIPDGVTNICDDAFSYCSNLTSIAISDSITNIGGWIFSDFTSLTSIIIPKSVTTIESSAFDDCEELKYVFYTGSEEDWSNINIGSWNESLTNSAIHYNSTDHTYGDWIIDVEPTCTEDGEKHHVCSVCNYSESAVALAGHYFTDGYCTVCGEEQLFEYSIENDCVTITGYLGTDANVVIPNTIDGLPVTTIGESAFYNCRSLISVEIPNSITSIEYHAFYACGYLESVFLGNSVASIDQYAFHFCNNLTSINVDENNPNYSSVDGVLFNKDETILIMCPQGKTEYTIPYTVTSIGDNAFTSCKALTSIIIPDSVTNIGYHSFGYCENLDSIVLSKNLRYIDSEAFTYCTSLTSIIIPDSVTNIGEKAFSNCSGLTTIDIPDSVIGIGNGVFSNCTNLTSINVDESNLNYSSDDGVLFNKDKTVLIQYPKGKPLTEYKIPDTVTDIHANAFKGCNNLVSISIPCGVTSIGEDAFYNCDSLTSIIIPDGVTSIGLGVFESCDNLTSVSLGVGIEIIPSNAFAYCASLASIVIPASITRINNYAFSKCNALIEVHYLGLLSDWDNIYIGTNNESLTKATISHLCTLSDWVTTSEPTCTEDGSRSKTCLVCGEVVTETIEATGHNYSDEWTIDIEATCTTPGSKSHHCTVCDDKTDITVIISGGHNYVVTDALSVHPHTTSYKCSYCEDEKTESPVIADCIECNFTITLMNSTDYKLVSYIGAETDVVITANYEGSAVTTIANSCFKGNTSVETVEIEEGVTTIGSLAFMNCTSLEMVYIPASVTSIGANAFYGFTGTIYCAYGSTAHKYAIANKINYVIDSTEELETPIQETEDTEIDFNNFVIFTSVKNCSDITEILGLSESATVVPTASYVNGNLELYGTGTIITVFDGNDYIGDFTLIVEGDLNGDSICNVLDAFEAERASNGHIDASTEQIYAANGMVSDDLDASSYQNVVNKALAS